jgi:hypothetical protein
MQFIFLDFIDMTNSVFHALIDFIGMAYSMFLPLNHFIDMAILVFYALIKFIDMAYSVLPVLHRLDLLLAPAIICCLLGFEFDFHVYFIFCYIQTFFQLPEVTFK